MGHTIFSVDTGGRLPEGAPRDDTPSKSVCRGRTCLERRGRREPHRAPTRWTSPAFRVCVFVPASRRAPSAPRRESAVACLLFPRPGAESNRFASPRKTTHRAEGVISRARGEPFTLLCVVVFAMAARILSSRSGLHERPWRSQSSSTAAFQPFAFVALLNSCVLIDFPPRGQTDPRDGSHRPV